MKKLILVFAVLIIHDHVNAQFIRVESGTTSNINSIEYSKGQIFFLGHQYLSKTTDQGDNLTRLNVPSDLPYTYSLNVLDTSRLYLVSAKHFPDYEYRVMHSADGGHTWNVLFDTTGKTVNDLTVTENGQMLGVGLFGHVVKSFDGIHWTNSNANNMAIIRKCKILSDNKYVICGFEYTAISSDTGNTWYSRYFNTSHCSEIVPVTPDTLYMSSYFWNGWESFFSWSFNGGNSWATKSMGKGIGIFDIDFVDRDQGYAVGFNYSDSVGIIMQTFDAGNTWITHSTNLNSELLAVKIINDSILFIAGTKGIILKSDLFITGVNSNARLPFEINLYPNPVNNNQRMEFKMEKAQHVRLTLHDVNGKLIREFHDGLIDGNAILELDISGIANGVYLYHVTTKEDTFSFKIIKQ